MISGTIAAPRARDPAIDIARGAAMILVLYAHALEMFVNFALRADHHFDPVATESWRAIFAFHMPAFYFISGMTAVRLGQAPLRKVLIGSLTLFFFAELTQILFAPVEILWLAHAPIATIARRALLPLAQGTGYNLVLTWFLVSLAIVRLLAWMFLRGGAGSKTLVWCVAILAYVGAWRSGYHPFTIQTWGAGLAFFLLGQAAASGGWLAKFSPPAALLIAIASGALLLLLYPLNRGCLLDPVDVCDAWMGHRLFGVSLVSPHLGFLPLFFVTAATGTVMLMILAQAMAPTFLALALTWIGRNTLTLIVINGAVVAFVQPAVMNRLPVSPAGISSLWALAFTAAQIGLLPMVRPVVTKLNRLSAEGADIVMARLGAVFPQQLSPGPEH